MCNARLGLRLSLAGLALLAACGGERAGNRILIGDEPDPIDGGTSGEGGNQTGSGPGTIDGSVDQALQVHVEDAQDLRLEVVTISCEGECVEVTAVASGGHAPYAFEWEDGSTTAQRTVCLDASATLSVTARDSGLDAGEFTATVQTASVDLPVNVLDCTTCEGDAELGLPERITPDLFGEPTYFADGDSLPAGRYRITYVDGCMRYDPEWGWTVNDLATNQFWVIGDGPTDILGVAPAESSIVPMFQDTFEECVEANLRAAQPFELTHDGGPLGIWQNDFMPPDNLPGVDGRSPTWELSRTDCE